MCPTVIALSLVLASPAQRTDSVDVKKLIFYTDKFHPDGHNDKTQTFTECHHFFIWNDTPDSITNIEFEASVSGNGQKKTVKVGVVPFTLVNTVAKDILPPNGTAVFKFTADFPYSMYFFGRDHYVKIVRAKKINNFKNLRDPLSLFAWFYKATPNAISAAFKKDPALAKVRGKIGETPMQMALMQPDPAKVKALQKLGMKLDVVNARKQSALHFAALASPKMIEYVCSQGAISRQDINGYNPMFYGIQAWEPSHIKALIKAKVPIDEPALKGVTATMFATTLGYYDSLELLLKNGANRSIRDNEGYSILAYALKHPPETFSHFSKLMGTVKTDEGHGRNLLHVAVLDHRYSLVPILLKSGVDPNKKNDSGETCWDIANKIEHPVDRQQMLSLMEPYRKKN